MSDWHAFLFPIETTILEVMKRIDELGEDVIVVCDSNQKLLGTVTDGDIRRGIINDTPVTSSIGEIMNCKPMKCLKGEYNHTQLAEIMETEKILFLPVVDHTNTIVDIKVLSDLKPSQVFDNPVVLMAGGMGTRLGELTKDTPKPLINVGGKPILQTIIEDLRNQGFKKFYISVNYKYDQIQDFFKDGEKLGVAIEYIKESKRLGTAGALALHDFKDTQDIVVMNADVLTKVNFKGFLDFHHMRNNVATMGVRKIDFQIPYGVISVEGEKITKINEKPVYGYFINAGIYIINAKVISHIPKDQKYDMPELFNQLIVKQNDRVEVFPIHEYWMDVGRIDDLKKAQSEYFKVFK